MSIAGIRETHLLAGCNCNLLALCEYGPRSSVWNTMTKF